ncbi:FtsX-like permease family protein [Saccharothrix syringae]|uniref:ABC transporter permease n=1 Tax=Saccharothrix syringae TaxID=103733 RepID=A0A5Q0GUX6_SACSY|nr:ABC transporter permease [Saccharothrix syringae]QFZ17808.1 ABC transporter permease [Saccharothrix syringae]
MLLVALASLRERRVSFAGAFLTLVFGVTLVSAAGLVVSAAGDDPAWSEAGSLLALFAGLGAFLTVFVVASTVGFTVSLRRKEFALLRMAGADPGQVFRVVQAEALVLGAAAALVGAVLGLPARSVLVAVLKARGVVPGGVELPVTGVAGPLLLAFGLGLVVAVLGAWPAARRAGAISPVEAFREAGADTRPVPLGRWVLGLLALGAGLGLLALLPRVPVEGRLPLALFVAQPLVVGLALIGPAVVPGATALAVAPLERFAGVTALVARQNLRTAVRRTASCAAPVLATIGITGSLLAGTDLLGAASRADAALLHTSDYRVTGPRLDPAAVPGSVPAVDSSVTAFVNRGSRSVAALGVTREHLADVLGLGAVTGDLDALTGDTAALPARQAAAFGVPLGGVLDLALADGTRLGVRVVALYEGPPLTGPVLLPADLVGAGSGPPPALLVRGGRPDVPGATVVSTQDWLASSAGRREDGMRLGAELLSWFALLYTLFAVANTVVMSFARRSAEFARLRVLGASPGQVLRVALWEAVGIAATGLVLGAAATALAVGGLWQALRATGLDVPLDLPWGALVAVAAGCAAVLLGTSLTATVVVLRTPRRPPAG